MSAPGADAAARLVGTMLEVVVAELAEPGRLRRGRQYARQGAVADLHVEPGLVTASVQGSRPQPYEASAHVPLTPGASARLASLVPSRRDVEFACTCPDEDEPCKHAVALMAAFAERVSYQPELFLRWRTGSAEAGVGAGAGGGVEPEPARLSDEDRAALDAFLGDRSASLPEPPSLPSLARPVGAWDDVSVEMLTSALDVLTRPTQPLRHR